MRAWCKETTPRNDSRRRPPPSRTIDRTRLAPPTRDRFVPAVGLDCSRMSRRRHVALVYRATGGGRGRSDGRNQVGLFAHLIEPFRALICARDAQPIRFYKHEASNQPMPPDEQWGSVGLKRERGRRHRPARAPGRAIGCGVLSRRRRRALLDSPAPTLHIPRPLSTVHTLNTKQ